MKKTLLLLILSLSFNVFGQLKYTHNPITHQVLEIEGSMHYNKIIIKDLDSKVIEQTEIKRSDIYFNMDKSDYDKKYIVTIYFEGEKKPQKFFYKVAYAYTKQESPSNVNRDYISFANDINYVANWYSTNPEVIEPAQFILYDKNQRKEIIFSK